MVLPWTGVGLGCASGTEWCDGCLGDDGSDLAHSSGKSVGCGAVASGEAFSRDDECCGVWT